MKKWSRQIGAWYNFLRQAVIHEPDGIPYFSMTRAERWLYFHFLDPVLNCWPVVIWRFPAFCIAAIRVCCEKYTDKLADEMLVALGRPSTWFSRLRFRWQFWFAHEAERFLLIQNRKLTPAWAQRNVTILGAMPKGGALVIMPHHSGRRAGILALSTLVGPLGVITGRPPDPVVFDQQDVTLRHVFSRGMTLSEQLYRGGVFFSMQGFAARGALRLMRDGGYLISNIDGNAAHPPLGTLFNKQVTMYIPGTIWLGARSGKPIVPIMTILKGGKWSLWIGQPILPTVEAIEGAIEECLRVSPVNWDLTVAMAWLRALKHEDTFA